MHVGGEEAWTYKLNVNTSEGTGGCMFVFALLS